MAETTTTTAIPELTQYLERLLAAGNYDAVKQLLEPEQPADAAEAIGNLPTLQQAIAFRLLPKNEAIEVYEYLDAAVQQSLLEMPAKTLPYAPAINLLLRLFNRKLLSMVK